MAAELRVQDLERKTWGTRLGVQDFRWRNRRSSREIRHGPSCAVYVATGSLRQISRLDCDRDRCRAVLDAELGIDLLKMLVDGARAQSQNLRDVAVGLALAEPRQYFAFP